VFCTCRRLRHHRHRHCRWPFSPSRHHGCYALCCIYATRCCCSLDFSRQPPLASFRFRFSVYCDKYVLFLFAAQSPPTTNVNTTNTTTITSFSQLQKLSPHLFCHAFRSVHSHFCFDCSCQPVVSFRRSFYTKATDVAVAVWRSVDAAVASNIVGHLSNTTLAPLLTSLPCSVSAAKGRHTLLVLLQPTTALPYSLRMPLSMLSAVAARDILALLLLFRFWFSLYRTLRFSRTFLLFFFTCWAVFFQFLLCCSLFTRRYSTRLLSQPALNSLALALVIQLSFSHFVALSLSQRLFASLFHLWSVCVCACLFVVVFAHTMALSGLGPGANFIQQFNSIIGSGYGYLFYTFFFIIIFWQF